MASLTRLLSVLLMVGSVFWTRNVQGVSKCTIPPGTSSRTTPNQDAINFAVTDITSSSDLLPIQLSIEEHTYTVDSCNLVLYLKSAIIEQDFLPTGTKVSGVSLSCQTVDNSPLQASGTILRYFDDALPKPDAIPNSWYEGDRLIQRIQFFRFPEPSSLTIRCGLKRTIDIFGEIELFEVITLTKIGCPKSHWGPKCNKTCLCENGGYCNTFEDSCVCIGEYDGARCNIHFGSTTTDPVNSTNNTFAESETGITTQNFLSVISNMTTSKPPKERPRELSVIRKDPGANMAISIHPTISILHVLCTFTVLSSFSLYVFL